MNLPISDLYINLLKKYFVFDKIFDLFDYAKCMEDLYRDLLPYVQESYPTNYRFIFLYFEPDFHVYVDKPGIIMLNLQRTLRDLNISNYFCMLISQQDFSKNLQLLQKTETNDTCSIASLPILDYYIQDFITPHLSDYYEPNINCIEHKYQSLNRINKFHRRIVVSLLKERNLLDNGMVSFNSFQDTKL